MCGICGFVSNKHIGLQELIKMNNTMIHRGPDDHGEEIFKISEKRFVGLAQRRLSILDLSFKGHQPMHSYDNKISVVFNGEIYNFKELKEKLTTYPFISNCDTEVIIAAYQKWGIGFVEKLNGMFAIALLDRITNTLYLVRDRIGKKPLYYYLTNHNEIVFASELKAIMKSSLFNLNINEEIIGRFLYRTYITIPDTIFKNTYKLEPGTIIEFSDKGIKKNKYWDVATKYNELKCNVIKDYEEEKEVLKNLLYESVKKRLISDVPVGAFLSGGYDSTLICAIAQKLSIKPLRTFSIGFEDKQFDEAPYSRNTANILGTNHSELYVTEKDMLNVIDSIPKYYDEPFADPSQIPTMIISELAKENVSVVLTGDGGDELFGGYNIYTILQDAQRIIEGNIRENDIMNKSSIIYRIVQDSQNVNAQTQGGVQNYLDKINSILLSPATNFYYNIEKKYFESRLDVRRMLLDIETSLPEDMLAKVDRATMKYSLEARCPFLDKEIVEFSFRCHPDFKDDHGNQKRIIKDLTYEYIPKELMDRPKKGFGIPQDRFLRGALKERIMDWTNEAYLKKQGIFKPLETRKFVENYMKNGDKGLWSGQNYSRIVWSFFMFQQWYDSYII